MERLVKHNPEKATSEPRGRPASMVSPVNEAQSTRSTYASPERDDRAGSAYERSRDSDRSRRDRANERASDRRWNEHRDPKGGRWVYRGGDRGGDRRGDRSNDRRGDSRSEQRYSNDSPHGEQSRWGGNSCYREHERDRSRSRRDYYSYD